jgi:hypothetical protein
LNEFTRGDRVHFAGQTVTVAIVYDKEEGRSTRSYLVEFSDGTFSRARQESLSPVEIAEPEKKSGLRPISSVMAPFFRRGAK